jgi:hypothetical protein
MAQGADEMEGYSAARLFLSRLREPDEAGVPKPAVRAGSQESPGRLLRPDRSEPELRPREIPLQEVRIEIPGPEMEDAGVDPARQSQPAVDQEVPGTNRVGVLPVAHEDSSRLGRREMKETRERAQEQDVRVTVAELVPGQERNIDQLERQGVPPPERQQGGPAREGLPDAFVRLGPRHDPRVFQALSQTVEILRRERAVVVHEKT